MPASSRIEVTSATNCSARQAAARAAARRTRAPPSRRGRCVARARPAARAASARGPRQRRGDDVAGLEVAVRRGAVRAPGSRTARRRRRRRRRPGPRPPAARSCGRPSRPRERSACQGAAPVAGPSTCSGGSAARQALEQTDQHDQLGAQLLEVAAGLVLVLQGPAEPEQRDRRRVRVDLDRAARPSRARVQVEPEPGRDPGAARVAR